MARQKIINVKNDVRDMLQDVTDRARAVLADENLGRVYINQPKAVMREIERECCKVRKM